jgi:transposase
MFAQIERQDPDWRSKYILMLDNASYHKSAMIIDYFKNASVPVLFTAPYSTVAVPVEFFFGGLKNGLLIELEDNNSRYVSKPLII